MGPPPPPARGRLTTYYRAAKARVSAPPPRKSAADDQPSCRAQRNADRSSPPRQLKPPLRTVKHAPDDPQTTAQDGEDKQRSVKHAKQDTSTDLSSQTQHAKFHSALKFKAQTSTSEHVKNIHTNLNNPKAEKDSDVCSTSHHKSKYKTKDETSDEARKIDASSCSSSQLVRHALRTTRQLPDKPLSSSEECDDRRCSKDVKIVKETESSSQHVKAASKTKDKQIISEEYCLKDAKEVDPLSLPTQFVKSNLRNAGRVSGTCGVEKHSSTDVKPFKDIEPALSARHVKAALIAAKRHNSSDECDEKCHSKNVGLSKVARASSHRLRSPLRKRNNPHASTSSDESDVKHCKCVKVGNPSTSSSVKNSTQLSDRLRTSSEDSDTKSCFKVVKTSRDIVCISASRKINVASRKRGNPHTSSDECDTKQHTHTKGNPSTEKVVTRVHAEIVAAALSQVQSAWSAARLSNKPQSSSDESDPLQLLRVTEPIENIILSSERVPVQHISSSDEFDTKLTSKDVKSSTKELSEEIKASRPLKRVSNQPQTSSDEYDSKRFAPQEKDDKTISDSDPLDVSAVTKTTTTTARQITKRIKEITRRFGEASETRPSLRPFRQTSYREFDSKRSTRDIKDAQNISSNTLKTLKSVKIERQISSDDSDAKRKVTSGSSDPSDTERPLKKSKAVLQPPERSSGRVDKKRLSKNAKAALAKLTKDLVHPWSEDFDRKHILRDQTIAVRVSRRIPNPRNSSGDEFDPKREESVKVRPVSSDSSDSDHASKDVSPGVLSSSDELNVQLLKERPSRRTPRLGKRPNTSSDESDTKLSLKDAKIGLRESKAVLVRASSDSLGEAKRRKKNHPTQENPSDNILPKDARKICDKTFDKKIVEHAVLHGEEILGNNPKESDGKRLSCKECGKKFLNAERLAQHSPCCSSEAASTENNPQDGKKHCCKECGKKFCSTGKLSQHILTHGPVESDPESKKSCKESGKRLTNVGKLSVNVTEQSGNDSEKKHFCNECGKKFCNAAKLAQHIIASHGKATLNDPPIADNKRHCCRECSKRFCSPGKLAQHALSHTGELPFACTLCDKRFNSKFKLVRHGLIHSKTRQFQCPLCERTFHRKDHLANHGRVHDPLKKIYTCTRESCRKQYTSDLSYRKHRALHSAEEGNLKCEICSETFEKQADIVYHLKVHAGSRSVKNENDKKFTCPDCHRKFFTGKDVRRHSVVHSKRRDFLCQFCPQKFGRKDHLVRHVKKAHPDSPWQSSAPGTSTENISEPVKKVKSDVKKAKTKAELKFPKKPPDPPPRSERLKNLERYKFGYASQSESDYLGTADIVYEERQDNVKPEPENKATYSGAKDNIKYPEYGSEMLFMMDLESFPEIPPALTEMEFIQPGEEILLDPGAMLLSETSGAESWAMHRLENVPEMADKQPGVVPLPAFKQTFQNTAPSPKPPQPPK